jgi:ribose-phosphate pyrophosphokinase
LGVPILADYVRAKKLEDFVVVSPDLGGVTRARSLADRLDSDIAIIEKRRPAPGVAEVMNIIGAVRGKTAVMIDDLVDTAGSLVEAANALIKFGAKDVYACCTHAVLTHPAVPRIENSPIKELVVTNTIPLPPDKHSEKIKVLSVAPIMGEAILRIYNEMSVSQLFNI